MSTSNQLPKIPTIKFVVTRINPKSFIYDSEEYEDFNEFEEWFIDECEKELYAAYRDADPDSRRGVDGMREWVKWTFKDDDYRDFLDDRGWKFSRVVGE